jgi:hypothetical protein
VLIVAHLRALVAVECRVLILEDFFLYGQKMVPVVMVVVVMVVVRKLVAGCRLLGVVMRVVAIYPGPSVQAAMLRIATAVIEERSSARRTCGMMTHAIRYSVP